MEKPPVLITLTSPTAAGKSYLFNYIRDIAKLSCLISTTTRAPRSGEINGVDYYFISDDESQQLEKDNQFAELAVYRNVRYGVTKQEWNKKLQPGKLAFLIVEPSGIDHYVKPALDVGAVWLKYFIHTDPEIRMQRFYDRMLKDVSVEISSDIANGQRDPDNLRPSQKTTKTILSYFDRHRSMLTTELQWGQCASWTRTLFGTELPENNLKIIMKDVDNQLSKWSEQHQILA